MTQLHILNPDWDEGLSRPRDNLDNLFQQISTAKNAPQLQWQVYRKINDVPKKNGGWFADILGIRNCGMRSKGLANTYTAEWKLGEGFGPASPVKKYADESFPAEILISLYTYHSLNLLPSSTKESNHDPRSTHQMHQDHHFQATFFPLGKTSSTTLVFWIFLWPTPVFLFVIFSDLRFDQVKAQGKNANSRSQLCTEEAFSIGEGNPWMMQDLHPRNERMRCFFLPHDTAIMKVHSIKKNGNGTYGISAD